MTLTTVIIGGVLLFILGCVFGYIASGTHPASAKAAKAVPQPKPAAPAPAKAPAAAPKAAKKPAARKTTPARKPARKSAAKTTATKRRAASAKDDLKLISGVGPALEKKLNKLGVKTYADIAQWKKADVERVDEELNFKGRIQREDWVKQAKVLAVAARRNSPSGQKDRAPRAHHGAGYPWLT